MQKTHVIDTQPKRQTLVFALTTSHDVFLVFVGFEKKKRFNTAKGAFDFNFLKVKFLNVI